MLLFGLSELVRHLFLLNLLNFRDAFMASTHMMTRHNCYILAPLMLGFLREANELTGLLIFWRFFSYFDAKHSLMRRIANMKRTDLV